MKSPRRLVAIAALIAPLGASCGLPSPETCFCGGDIAKRYRAMEDSGKVIDSLQNAVVREATEGNCVCVPAEQLATVTEAHLGQVKKAVDLHFTKNASYPATLEDLVGAGGISEELTQDAWFKALHYEIVEGPKFRLCSGFADGVVGTADDVCDDSFNE